MTGTAEGDPFKPGTQFRSGTWPVEADRIKAFAAEFDPQPQHLDEAEASESQFGGLVASGWHTASMGMRLFIDSVPVLATGAMGSGVDELRWFRPVRPGDILTAITTVQAARRSASRPEKQVVTCEVVIANQREERVLRFLTTMIIAQQDRPVAGGDMPRTIIAGES